MVDFFLVVEAFLDQERIPHYRDARGVVAFDLSFGHTSYAVEVRQERSTLFVSAELHRCIPAAHISQVTALLQRLVNAGAGGGKTYLNVARGMLRHETSVDFSMAELTVPRFGDVLESLLDPFNVMILAMKKVIEGELSADVAVESYGVWDRKRIATLMRSTKGDDDIDPSLN